MALIVVYKSWGLWPGTRGWFSEVHCQDSSPFSLPVALINKAWLHWYYTNGWKVKRSRGTDKEGGRKTKHKISLAMNHLTSLSFIICKMELIFPPLKEFGET